MRLSLISRWTWRRLTALQMLSFFRLPGREADGVALLADAVAHAVDPAVAERLVQRLRISEPAPA
jgi:hypothetical protein